MLEIMRCVFGSHLYGLNGPNSDTDIKGIYLPTRDELLLGKYAKSISHSTGDDKSKNTAGDTDYEMYSLPYFIELACKGETVAVDMLHAIGTSSADHPELFEIWQALRAMRHMFYTKDMRSYVGYARKQANKYGIKGSRIAAVETVQNWLKTCVLNSPIRDYWDQLPTGEFLRILEETDKSSAKPLRFYEVCGRKYQDTLTVDQLYNHMGRMYAEYGERAQLAKDNNGIDWKAVSHSLRASYQMLGILKDGDFTYPLPQTRFLLDVKQGKLDFVNEVQPELERAIEEIEMLAERSALPKNVPRGFLDQWLLNVYERHL